MVERRRGASSQLKLPEVSQTEQFKQRVAVNAYGRFEARGRMHGFDKEDWMAAEQEELAKLTDSKQEKKPTRTRTRARSQAAEASSPKSTERKRSPSAKKRKEASAAKQIDITPNLPETNSIEETSEAIDITPELLPIINVSNLEANEIRRKNRERKDEYLARNWDRIYPKSEQAKQAELPESESGLDYEVSDQDTEANPHPSNGRLRPSIRRLGRQNGHNGQENQASESTDAPPSEPQKSRRYTNHFLEEFEKTGELNRKAANKRYDKDEESEVFNSIFKPNKIHPPGAGLKISGSKEPNNSSPSNPSKPNNNDEDPLAAYKNSGLNGENATNASYFTEEKKEPKALPAPKPSEEQSVEPESEPKPQGEESEPKTKPTFPQEGLPISPVKTDEEKEPKTEETQESPQYFLGLLEVSKEEALRATRELRKETSNAIQLKKDLKAEADRAKNEADRAGQNADIAEGFAQTAGTHAETAKGAEETALGYAERAEAASTDAGTTNAETKTLLEKAKSWRKLKLLAKLGVGAAAITALGLALFSDDTLPEDIKLNFEIPTEQTR